MRPAPADAVELLRRPEVLWVWGVRQVTKTVLFPVRFLYTAATSSVGTNQSAAQRCLADRRRPAAELVAAALTWRDAPPDAAPAMALLRRDMIPLYLRYIDDHVARLTAVGRFDLVDAFRQWRGQITT